MGFFSQQFKNVQKVGMNGGGGYVSLKGVMRRQHFVKGKTRQECCD